MDDVVVVGGGVIGLSIARALRQDGWAVTVLERGRAGHEASWASAGIVPAPAMTAATPDPYEQLEALSARLYPELVAELRDETGLDVEYTQDGWLVPASSAEEAAAVEASVRLDRARGLASEFVAGPALRAEEPALAAGVVAAKLSPGGHVENRRLVRALELAVRQQGVRVVSGAAVVEVLHEGGRVRGVRTLLGDVPASAVVLAAGSWSGQIRGTMLDLPVVPQRGQILAVWRGALEFRRVILAPGDPYLVPRRDGRVIVGATRELVGYDPSLTVEGVGWLLSSAERLVPGVRSASIAEMWTGFRPFSPDGRPVIGRGRLDGLYYATGHGANGITLAPGTARVVASMLRGEAPPVPVDAFSPLRFG
ncbi:MAG TPA: glycine oxidase ThiO [Chloroflexota bacterium]